MQYLTPGGKLPPYMAYPRFLLGMDLSETAKLVYVFLLERCVLIRVNGQSVQKRMAAEHMDAARKLLARGDQPNRGLSR